jgi:RimJ/RimL family protein N-acetyltransferase
MTVLSGLLVDLVPFTPEYLDEKLHRFWNNESRYWAGGGDRDPITRGQIKRMLQEWPEGDAGIRFMLRARDDAAIGTISLNRIQPVHGWAEIGIWIGEADYWRGGHGTDALLLIAQYAFDWLALRRLHLLTMGNNTGMQVAAQRCGFGLEARLRQVVWADGAWIDALQFGLFREGWPGRPALVETLGLAAKAEQRYGKVD